MNRQQAVGLCDFVWECFSCSFVWEDEEEEEGEAVVIGCAFVCLVFLSVCV